MRAVVRKWAVGVVAAGLVLGCGREPAPEAGTGAREAAQAYFEALLQKDWPRAYAGLCRDGRGRVGAEEFGRLAENYRGRLGFEPRAVHVRACEEQGDRAVAHVAWTGPGAARRRPYRDAVELRRDNGEWGVVLPKQFGQGKR
jgi:hypothetical protein